MSFFTQLNKVRGRLIPRFIRLSLPYFNSEKRWTARGLLFLLVMLMLADTLFAVLLNWQTGEFSTAWQIAIRADTGNRLITPLP